jgi:hypothetical protein
MHAWPELWDESPEESLVYAAIPPKGSRKGVGGATLPNVLASSDPALVT